MTNPTQKQKPLLFLLEDDAFLLTEMTKLAEEAGWEVISARYIDDAIRLMEAKASQLKLSLLDLMVPKSEMELEKLDQLLKDRNHLIREQAMQSKGREPNEQALVSIREKLLKIDSQIQSQLKMSGGVDFLEHLKERKDPIQIGGEVGLFSARSRNEAVLDRAAKVLNNTQWLGYFPKPIETDEFLGILADRLR